MHIISENNTTKKYSELNRWDIIEAYHGKKLRPCVVVSRRIKADGVTLKLHPLTEYTKSLCLRKIETHRFQPQAWVEVLGSRQIFTPEDQVKENILSILQPGREPLGSLQIIDEAKKRGLKVPAVRLKVNNLLRELAKEKLLILRERNHLLVRAPLAPGVVGIPVLELPSTRSEALGWVESWREMRNGDTLPVVRFLDGTSRVCPEQRIDPTEYPVYVRWVEQVRSGTVPEPEEFLSRDILQACDIRSRQHDCLPEAAELAIAKYLGLVPEDMRARTNLGPTERVHIRNETLKHLNTYYPGWRFGVNVHAHKGMAA